MTAMSQMMEALRFASQNQATSLTIENESVDLKAGAAFFVTYNPGYPGRTELPQAVKNHFRSITYARPDHALIYENMAASHGYSLEDIPTPVAQAFQQATDTGMRHAKAVFKKSWGNFKLSASVRMNNGANSSNLEWFIGNSTVLQGVSKYNYSMGKETKQNNLI